MIEINSVKKSFGSIPVLNGVDLSLEEGGQYVIQGASGSGKSTLLYIVGGLDRPSSGSIKIAGENLLDLKDEQLARYRNRYLGFVFQFHFLLSSMDCLNNMLLPSRIGNTYSNDIRDHVLNLCEELGITHCLKKYPFEISGGEQQRVNIVRALSLKPKLLLCDEPTGNLDSKNSEVVANLLSNLSRQFGSTLLLVTHDNNIAAKFSSRFLMEDGLIVQ